MVFDNNSSDFEEKMQRCREYMEALESERRKIQVFERELPLCLELVTRAIEGCRQQMSGTTNDYFNGQSECSEQTSSEGPVLEEFIPIKRTSSADEDDQEHQHQHQEPNHKPMNICTKDKSSSSSKKSDWLRSAQLSIQTPDPVELSPKRVPVVEVKRNGCGAFHPFKKEKNPEAAPAAGTAKLSTTPATDPTAAASSTAETGSGSGGCGGSKSEDKGQSNRKARRCWSPELHRRFLHALQQLGGAHVATPKQIRELMKVDGLTNDEVKSHLQKYRLHTRRPSPTIHNNNPQTPQFVVVGGIWMPPPEYTTMAATSTPTSGDTNNSKGVYAPIASHQPSIAEASVSLNKSNSGEKDGGHFHLQESPSTSSSTHTTTASPIF
ncbi:transcription factor HHO3-like [Cynara cardunculus var. scolymus]|uniref:transcription factor HHO3-like n=1 Tax=Cynara cardunculus var. scolymus TaxID=59895 RepID=UPI000D62BCB3|nr:transcription factor HHO3-like [Cynara cardunculus var. scolymus]